MSEKKKHNFKSAFDDRKLPVNDLTVERMEEIEQLIMPSIKNAIEKIRKEKPSLFKS